MRMGDMLNIWWFLKVLPIKYLIILRMEEAAPLLCGGSVGYRALKLSGMKEGKILGLTGFGGSGNQVLQLSKFLYPTGKVYVFARSEKGRELAEALGADWTGDTSMEPLN